MLHPVIYGASEHILYAYTFGDKITYQYACIIFVSAIVTPYVLRS